MKHLARRRFNLLGRHLNPPRRGSTKIAQDKRSAVLGKAAKNDLRPVGALRRFTGADK